MTVAFGNRHFGHTRTGRGESGIPLLVPRAVYPDMSATVASPTLVAVGAQRKHRHVRTTQTATRLEDQRRAMEASDPPDRQILPSSVMLQTFIDSAKWME